LERRDGRGEQGVSPEADAALGRYAGLLEALTAMSVTKGCRDSGSSGSFRPAGVQVSPGGGPAEGRFRSPFWRHFLANQRRHHRAQKRGGGVSFVSLDDPATDEGGSLQITGPGLTQERIFERQWASALLDLVLTRLQAEFVEHGKARLFEEAKAFLTGAKQSATYEEAARRMGMSPAALKMAVVRMRQRYGELLRAEIARTVSSPEEVEPELRALFAALSPAP
jgi:RNA polymerase sigma-70 factor (ECF subfamily)